AHLAFPALHEIKAGHIGQTQIDHHAVEAAGVQHLERLCAGARTRDLDVAPAEQLANTATLGVVVLHHQKPLGRTVDEGVNAVERPGEGLLRYRLGEEIDGPEAEAALPSLHSRHHAPPDR